MANFLFLFIVLFIVVSCSTRPVALNRELCSNIMIYSSEEIDLNEIERKLVCGDPDDIAYKVIPIYQAKFMLQGFLQSRGFSYPRFVYENGMLNVYPEKKYRVQDVVINSENEIDQKRFEKEIFKRFKNEVITPKLLDEIEAKAKSMARDEGYPCVKVTSEVTPLEGKVILTFSGLKSFQFGSLTKESVEGVNEVALERFPSFKADELFSERELALTEKRYLRQGIVQGTYFQENCNLAENSFSLQQHFIVGPPRTIRFGVGASTELGPMTRAKWSNQRYGDMASVLEARLQASLKNQSIKLRVENFLWKSAPRRSLNSELTYSRNIQDTFRESTATLKPQMQWTRDSYSRFWLWSAGPTLIDSTYKTDVAAEERSFKTGAIEGVLQAQTHTYEIYDINPEDGEFYQFNFDFRHPSFGFTDRLLKLDLSYLKLLTLGYFGKGHAIAGLRLNTSTTWIKDVVPSATLPPSVKFYGGGSDDLRGYKLNSLPDNNGLGALTKLSAKLEFRKTHFFKPTIESFTFVDATYFGDRPWSLESRLWYSPGLGIRWISPIGLVQTYAARSLSNKSSANFDKDSGTLLYIGLGGIF